MPRPPRDIRLAGSPADAAAVEAARVRELQKAAYDQGRADAEKALRDELVRQRAEMGAYQDGLLRSLKSAASEVVQQSESLLVDLAFEVAQRLASGVAIGREAVAAAVQEALDQIDSSTEVTVQLHPEDLALFEQIPPPQRPGAALIDSIRLVPSPLVGRGGCVVQTHFGVIDNQRETRLRNLRASLAP
jgi:flagellar assembly protein FliH